MMPRSDLSDSLHKVDCGLYSDVIEVVRESLRPMVERNATDVWLVRQMLTNRWARELAVLSMENDRRRAENEVVERLRMSQEDDR